MKTNLSNLQKLFRARYFALLSILSLLSFSAMAEDIPCCLPSDFVYTNNNCSVCLDPIGDCPVNQYTVSWDFGDGITSTDYSPCHQYSQSGTYTVNMQVCCVEDPDRCESYKHDIVVECFCYVPCTVNAVFVVEEIAPYAFILWDYSTPAYGYTVTSWSWTVNGVPFSTGPTPVFVANNPGTYDICLTVTASNGTEECSSEFCWPVTYSDCNCPLSPDMNYESGHPGNLDYEFHGSAGPTTTCTLDWLWDFGDGSTAATQDAFHTYAAPGTYTVCLTVTMYCPEFTCVRTYCEEVTVMDDCPCPSIDDIDITITNIGNCQFNITYSGVPDCFSLYAGHWNLPDGGHDVTGNSIIYSAPSNGNYNGTLTLVIVNMVTHDFCEIGPINFSWHAECGEQSNMAPEEEIKAFKVTPNPNVGDMNISFFSTTDGVATIQIRDLHGAVLSSDKISYSHGVNMINLNKASVLKSGTYSVNLITSRSQQNVKTIVIK